MEFQQTSGSAIWHVGEKIFLVKTVANSWNMDRNEFPYFKASILEDIIEEELVEVKVKAAENHQEKKASLNRSTTTWNYRGTPLTKNPIN